MKQNKFRVWDSLAKKFLDEIFDVNSSSMYYFKDKLDYYNLGESSVLTDTYSHFVFQPFVNLVDTDATDIYEGDIVTCSFKHGPTDNISLGVIEFNDAYAYMGVKIIKSDMDIVGTHPKPFSNFMTIQPEFGFLIPNITIIGNILENPELLE